MKRLDIRETREVSSTIALTAVGSASAAAGGAHAAAFSESALTDIEARYPEGLSTQEIVELFAAHGERLSEATFRKYVQLGLLPRSVRVGRKGKHRGSQGRYPASVVRQIDAVRLLMAQGFTIQDIQREFLCVRSDIDALSRLLTQVLGALSQAAAERSAAVPDEVLERAVVDAHQSADALVEKLRTIEQRLAMRARMARAAV
jgi:DNA-binding transcriptional MerR regulator